MHFIVTYSDGRRFNRYFEISDIFTHLPAPTAAAQAERKYFVFVLLAVSRSEVSQCTDVADQCAQTVGSKIINYRFFFISY